MTTDGGAARVSSGTSTRFVLLVAAVLASSVSAFTWVYLAVPAKAELFRTVMVGCAAKASQFSARPAESAATHAPDRAGCRPVGTIMQPVYVDEAFWVTVGVALEFGLAGLLYLLHPWWSARGRRRMALLANDDCADLVEDFNGLASRMGLARTPQWLVAPNAATRGGQAFGLPWRPRVCLDAG